MDESTPFVWQAEVKFRQGSHVRRFDNEDNARKWIRGRIKESKKTVNPSQGVALIHLGDRPELPYPQVPFFNAEELLKDESFWNPR